jgi:hypothetical protein
MKFSILICNYFVVPIPAKLKNQKCIFVSYPQTLQNIALICMHIGMTKYIYSKIFNFAKINKK